MGTHLTASRAYPVPVEQAFDAVLSTPLPELFRHRYGPLPPIRSVTGFTEPWATAGQTRRITLSDGGTLLESLTEVARPTRFAYRISEITGALKPWSAASTAPGRSSRPAPGCGSPGPGTSSRPRPPRAT